MPILKCKMCGGALEINNNESVVECEYCGTQQTIPTTSDDVITNLYNRANNLRLKGEFDKASQIYEKIVEKNDSEAEAHWGIVLCKYGIEYVEDPQTMRRIPTCHRTSFDAITQDVDYKAAVDYADSLQQAIYEKEARAIDKIQKDILSIANNEEPFDVFICYKETDENGKRTIDSTIANDIYYQLTEEGFKVFYAAITLEDKLGQEYEPYIFAALNSAKVMLVLGTKQEYFSAIWVKNEWSRFLNFMKKDRTKLLIPCYRDMDAYDLPEEFAHLQAQDMNKIGFINDVVRGIKKVVCLDKNQAEVTSGKTLNENGTTIVSLLKRTFMFLEDGEWSEAERYCDKVLDIEPENAQAYLGKMLAELHIKTKQDLYKADPFGANKNYQKIIRFCDDDLKKELKGYLDAISIRIQEEAYSFAVDMFENAQSVDDYKMVELKFHNLNGFRDSIEYIKKCKDAIDTVCKSELYEQALLEMSNAVTISQYQDIANQFNNIQSFKDAEFKAKECFEKIDEIEKCKQMIFELEEMNKEFFADYDYDYGKFRKRLSFLEKKEAELLSIQTEFPKIMQQISDINIQVQNFENQIRVLEDEINHLGVFAIKQKHSNNTKIFDCKKRIETLEITKQSLIEDCKGYQTLEHIGKEMELIEREKKIIQTLQGCTCSNLICMKHAMSKSCQKGEVVSFGRYKTNLNLSTEHHEWDVLDVKEGKALLMSKYAITAAYHNAPEFVTWETCSLRKWLNEEFVDMAFTENEKKMLCTVNVSADKNPCCKQGEEEMESVIQGNDTQDKIFLLSVVEVEKYLPSCLARICHSFTDSGEAFKCIWLTRTLTAGDPQWVRKQSGVCFVNDEGVLRQKFEGYKDDVILATQVNGTYLNLVRPAFWIDLNA